MKKILIFIIIALFTVCAAFGQEIIPLNEKNWTVQAKSHVFENFKGKDAIYIQQGGAALKDTTFKDGTVEFDVYLTERQAFPGVYFRAGDDGDLESFFLRPHLSGKPDANQAAPSIGGVTAFQLYFGPTYSFTYEYNFNGWTHIKLVVNGKRAQVYLDYAKKPHLSWNLKLPPKEGKIGIGGSFAPMHYADFKIDKNAKEIVDFKVIEPEPIKDIVQEWEISDKFEEKMLDDPSKLQPVIDARKWEKKIRVEENNAANISTVMKLRGEVKGNTVFARLKINSDKDQIKVFEFGYSDRAVAILNGTAIYKGTTRWRTRDYRYLGTVGLFDAVFLNLKKGENTLLLAISEDFGGWGVTGKFTDQQGVKINQ